jgi:hypothetical protein
VRNPPILLHGRSRTSEPGRLGKTPRGRMPAFAHGSRHASKRVRRAAGLSQSRQWGPDQSPSGQFGCKSRQVRSTLPAQGAVAGHSRDSGADRPGDPREKRERRKAQLRKSRQGMAGEIDKRWCRTGKGHRGTGRGALLVSSPRKTAVRHSRRLWTDGSPPHTPMRCSAMELPTRLVDRRA